MGSKAKEFISGLKWGLPIGLGYLPVGITYAIMARQAGFSVLETTSMSLFVFAGASQMMAVEMYAQGASIIAMILTTFVLNLRHFIMSTCVINQMQNGKMPSRILSCFGVTDESFAVYTMQKKERCTILSFSGLVLSSYGAWVLSSLIGSLISSVLPDLLSASMAISLYAMFIAIVVPNIKGNLRLGLLVAFTALFNSALTYVFSLLNIQKSWAMIVSTLVCAFIGVFFVKDKKEAQNEN